MSASYQLAKYRTAPELTVVNNGIAIGDRRFESTAAIVEWCRDVKDNESRAERLSIQTESNQTYSDRAHLKWVEQQEARPLVE